MGWFGAQLIGLLLMHAAPAAASPPPAPGPSPVIARCEDFVRVVDRVFSGRSGATFEASGERAELGGDTFGPGALLVGGVDPARYLSAACPSR